MAGIPTGFTTFDQSGTAMDRGSFPIENESDLKNAIQAVGRAKDPENARLTSSAGLRLGKTELIPDSLK